MDTEESNKGQVGLVVVIGTVIICNNTHVRDYHIAVSIAVLIILSSLLPIYITPCTCMRCASKVGARITNDKIRRRTTPNTSRPKGKGSRASPGPGARPDAGPATDPGNKAGARSDASPCPRAGASPDESPGPRPCLCASMASRRAAAS